MKSTPRYTPPGIEHSDLRLAHRPAPGTPQSRREALGHVLIDRFFNRSGKYACGVPCYTYRERRTGAWR